MRSIAVAPWPAAANASLLADRHILIAGFECDAALRLVGLFQAAGAHPLACAALSAGIPAGRYDLVLAFAEELAADGAMPELAGVPMIAAFAPGSMSLSLDWARRPDTDCVIYPCSDEELLMRAVIAIERRRKQSESAARLAVVSSGTPSLVALHGATSVDRQTARGMAKALEVATCGDGFHRRLLDCLADGVYFVDTQRRITYWNRGAEQISGYSAAEVVGQFCRDNLLEHTDIQGRPICQKGCPFHATLRDGGSHQADLFLKHRDGHRVPVSVRTSAILDPAGRIVGGVEVFNDNSSKMAAIERADEMERIALIDPLTGVGNRRYTERILERQRELFRREGEISAVLFIDLDHFKAVNDTYGHDAGDAVLRAVARTVANNLRTFDFLGRWGGEEFIAVLNRTDANRAVAVAKRCRGLARSCQVEWEGRTIRPTVSIGVAVIRPDETSAQLIARADAQLYQAKQAGRDRVCGP
jgi:diguanylate cyclase (GGDEF)-like protein/PAS domain S-box-containing protein